MKTTLVTTLKDEGPYIWEWVAHHLLVGFDNIIIYHNDTEDGSRRILRALADAGIIQFHVNRQAPGRHQVRAYIRSTELEAYREADWVMALDLDEFLVIKAGDGTLSALFEAIPDADNILVNWKLFGSSGYERFSDELVSSRFLLSEPDETVRENLKAYKSLFRRDKFIRPGVHRPRPPEGMTYDSFRLVNGSGLTGDECFIKKFRCTDPKMRAFAQVNHYNVRDAESFVLKSDRGSAHQIHREIGQTYWYKRNHNEEPDHHILRYHDDLLAVMETLDIATDGKMKKFTQESIAFRREKFENLLKEPEFKALFEYCVEHPGMPAEQASIAQTEANSIGEI